MKLILLRHAKSSWDDPLLSDHARPLNERGIKSAQAIGAWLRAQGHAPAKILCSTAARTRQTRDLIGFQDVETAFSDKLYHAGTATLSRAIAEETSDCLMLIGHNPGLGDLALQLADHGLKDDALQVFPTCACLVLKDGAPMDFTVPRRLIEV